MKERIFRINKSDLNFIPDLYQNSNIQSSKNEESFSRRLLKCSSHSKVDLSLKLSSGFLGQ